MENVVECARSNFNQINILINSAGSAPAGSFFDLSDNDFIDSWNLKLLGAIRMVKAVAPHMIKKKAGSIVHIIGNAARTPSAKFLPGSTTNAALLSFTKGISKELAEHNVRVNAISPGVTATDRANKSAIKERSPKALQ